MTRPIGMVCSLFVLALLNTSTSVVYLEMDESQVAVYNIANLGDLAGSIDPFRFALTGTKNATIKLKLAKVKAAAGGDIVESVISFEQALPDWTEYVSRLGWLDDEHVFVIAVNRLQNHAALLRINTVTLRQTVIYEEKVCQNIC